MRDDFRELITAYHDGELGPEASVDARQMIASNVEASRYYEALKRSDDLLRQAFDPILDKPIPKGFDFSLRRQHVSRWIPMALAASVAVIAVLVVRQGQFDRQFHERFDEMQRELAALRNQTLEDTPSGTSATWIMPSGESRVEVVPVKTYRTTDNRYCREYEERITDADGVEIRRGIACRVGKGNWPDEPAMYSKKKDF